MEKVKKTDSCWIWTAAKTPNGYGAFAMNGRGTCMGAHRASYKIHCGEIPDGMCVLHRCDNPSCVNPEHLFLGTHKDNNSDMVAKGRHISKRPGWVHPHGEQVKHKLSEHEVMEIKRRYVKWKPGIAQALAKEFGVYISTVRKIASGETWRHISERNIFERDFPIPISDDLRAKNIENGLSISFRGEGEVRIFRENLETMVKLLKFSQ